jgi:hypothetical protein
MNIQSSLSITGSELDYILRMPEININLFIYGVINCLFRSGSCEIIYRISE